jgi:O-antigen/teichoic acid export membrane protein
MRLAQNVLTTLTARFIALGLSLATSVLLARMLGPEGRGVFATTLILPGFAIALGALGFSEANAVYAGLNGSKNRVLVWQSCVVALGIGGVFVLATAAYVALGAPGLDGLIRAPLLWYLLPLGAVPLMLLADHWLSIVRGMNRILVVNVFEVGTKLATVLLLYVLVGGLQLGVAGAVWATCLMQAGTIVVLTWLLWRGGLLGAPSWDTALWRQSWRFALPAYASSVVVYFNYRLDEVLIARFLTPVELGHYAIAVALVERLWILTGAVGFALLPHLTSARDRDPALAAQVARHVLVWTGLACLGLFVLADVVVRTLYSTDFAPAVSPLRWLLPGILTLSVARVIVGEILARKKPELNLVASVLATTVNLAANLVLIPRLGITGAAIASSLSYTILSALIVWFYRRETGLPITTLLPRWSDRSAYIALVRQASQVVIRYRRPSISFKP